MITQELAVLFACETAKLVGILHQSDSAAKTGIVMVVAGGPQYRVGRARQLLTWARQLASEGYPVLRFDYRGLGDSSGDFLGFEQIDQDIKSAIDTLVAHTPQIKNIILWGECNSASAIMIYAWQDPRVKGMIIRDPWVREESTQAKAYIKYYYWQRLREKAFWEKLLQGRINMLQSASSIIDLWKKAKLPKVSAQQGQFPSFKPLSSTLYQDKMLEGFSRFSGKTLLLINCSSLTGKEFEVLVESSPHWQKVMAKNAIVRIDDCILESDNFSLLAYSLRISKDTLNWLGHTEW